MLPIYSSKIVLPFGAPVKLRTVHLSQWEMHGMATDKAVYISTVKYNIAGTAAVASAKRAGYRLRAALTACRPERITMQECLLNPVELATKRARAQGHVARIPNGNQSATAINAHARNCRIGSFRLYLTAFIRIEKLRRGPKLRRDQSFRCGACAWNGFNRFCVRILSSFWRWCCRRCRIVCLFVWCGYCFPRRCVTRVHPFCAKVWRRRTLRSARWAEKQSNGKRKRLRKQQAVSLPW